MQLSIMNKPHYLLFFKADDSFKIITTKSVLILELPGKSTFMCELKFKPSQVSISRINNTVVNSNVM